MSEDATCVEVSTEGGVLAATSSSGTSDLHEIFEEWTIKGNIHLHLWIDPGFCIGPESQEYWPFQDFLIPMQPLNVKSQFITKEVIAEIN